MHCLAENTAGKSGREKRAPKGQRGRPLEQVLRIGFEDFRTDCNEDCTLCQSKRACDDMARFYNYVLRKLDE